MLVYTQEAAMATVKTTTELEREMRVKRQEAHDLRVKALAADRAAARLSNRIIKRKAAGK